MKLKRKLIVVILSLISTVGNSLLANETAATSLHEIENKTEKIFTIGVVPQQSARALAKLWTPISQYLSIKTGLNIRFSTAKDIPTFERRLLEGVYDIAYMNPYHFTVFNQKPGYQAIAKEQQKKIKGIIVVPKDSPIQKISELHGAILAFPAPAAFAASVLPAARFSELGIAITPKYVSSHDSVYLSVARGFFPAGGGVMRTFNNTPKEIKDKLKILWQTPGYTPHALAVHPRLKADTIANIQEAILNMNKTQQGKQLLASVKFKDLGAAKNSDWDDVRALDIKALARMLEE